MDPISATLASGVVTSILYDVGKFSTNKGLDLVRDTPERRAVKKVLEQAFEYTFHSVSERSDSQTASHVCELLKGAIKSGDLATILLKCVITKDEVSFSSLSQSFQRSHYDQLVLPIDFDTIVGDLILGLHRALSEELSSVSSPLFNHVTTDRLDAVLSSMQKLRAIEKNQNRLLEQNSKILDGMGELSGAIKYATTDATPLIEDARAKLSAGRILAAGTILESIRAKQWGGCSRPQKLSILKCLARVKELAGEVEAASRLRFEAVDCADEQDEKDVLEAFAYTSIGNFVKAHELASAIILKTKHSSDVWSIWIQTVPEGLSFEEIESSVPESVLHDAEVLNALSIQARSRNNFEVAETYARKAMEAAPDSALATYFYGLALLQKQEGHLSDAKLSSQAQTEILLSIDRMRHAVTLFGGEPPHYWERQIQLNLSLALKMVGQPDDAFDVLTSLQRHHSEDPDVASHYARALASTGNLIQAKRVLEKAIGRKPSDFLAWQLMGVLVDEVPPDREGALEIADKALEIPIDIVEHRFLLVAMAVITATGSDEQEKVEGYLRASQGLPGQLVAVLEANAAESHGKIDEARAKLQELSVPDLELHAREVRRFAAAVAERVGMLEFALGLRRSLLPVAQFTKDTGLFLSCATKCGKDVDVLDECERLRKQGVVHSELFEFELGTLVQAGCFLRAQRLVEHYAATDLWKTYCAEIVYHRISLALMSGESEAQPEDISKLPCVEVVEPWQGECIVKMLYKLGECQNAVEYAYRLWRRFPDSVEAHRSLLAGLEFDAPFGDIDAEIVAHDSAVQYELDDGSSTDWIVLEADNPQVSRCEYGEDSPSWAAVLGKTKGSVFTLRATPEPPVKAKILCIMSKYCFRVRESMTLLAHRFGDESGIRQFNLRPDASGGLNTDQIVAALSSQKNALEERLRLYDESPIPIAFLAETLHRGVFSLTTSLHRETGRRVYCCCGGAKERHAHLADLSESNTLVIEHSVLATLISAGVSDFLRRLNRRILVSEGVVLELKTELLESRKQMRTEGNLGLSGAGLSITKLDRSVQEKWCEALDQLIEVIEECCEVESGDVIYELPTSKRIQLSEAFSRSTVQTLALASRNNHVLWTEDWRLYSLAKTDLGLKRRVWTQLIAFHRHANGLMTSEEEATLTTSMLSLGFVHMGLTESTILRLLEDSSFSPEHPAVRLLFDQIEVGQDSPDFVLELSCHLLRLTWQRAVSDLQCSAFTVALLSKLRTLKNGKFLVFGLSDAIDVVFGLDVLTGGRCRETVDAWIHSNVG